MNEARAPDPRFPRLTGRAFPPYRFYPGRKPQVGEGPHHLSPGRREPLALDEYAELLRDWRGSEHFCYGVDLYNYAYWWEAHEAWEPLWLCGPRGDAVRGAMQALIQVAAAHLQLHLGHARGVRALLERAGKNLTAAGGGRGAVLGFQPDRWFAEAVVPYFEQPGSHPYPFLVPQPPAATGFPPDRARA